MPEVVTIEDVAVALRAQLCPHDDAFDMFLPDALRAFSREYWTPLRVAVRIAAWLDALDIRSVVDIGAGAGKFCVAAALASRCRFVGFEQRAWLVDAARTLANMFDVSERVEFIHGALGETAPPLCEAYYFFNPFGENLFIDGHLDDDVELGDERFDRDVAAAQALLRDAPMGTYVFTYNGLGGAMPAGYTLLGADRRMPCELCLWRKEPSSDVKAKSRARFTLASPAQSSEPVASSTFAPRSRAISTLRI